MSEVILCDFSLRFALILVYKLYPELRTMECPKDVIVEKIKSAVYEAWEQISDKFFYRPIGSMQARVKSSKKD